jgi:hypothetical protein
MGSTDKNDDLSGGWSIFEFVQFWYDMYFPREESHLFCTTTCQRGNDVTVQVVLQNLSEPLASLSLSFGDSA